VYAVELRVFLARDTDVVDDAEYAAGFNASYTPFASATAPASPAGLL